MKDDLTQEQAYALLLEACRREGGQKAWAIKHGVSAPYVNDLVRARRNLTPKVLKVLGLERVVVYRKLKPGGRK